MVRMTHWLGMLLLICTSSGCGHFFDYVDGTAYHIKCTHRAKMAWMDARDLYGCVSHPYNFGEGFRAGYADVCMGNDSGCSPAVPPRRYWSSSYLNCEGRGKAAAWADGFAHGALAASCDGCAGQCQIATFGGGGYSGGGGGGNGGLGTALKGYRPPQANNPYGLNPPVDDDADDLEPTPDAPPPADGADRPDRPEELDGLGPDDGELVPEPPTATGLPLEVWRHPMAPESPRTAEAYHAPVF